MFTKVSYADIKTALADNGWCFYYIEEVANSHFDVYCGDRHTKLFAIAKGSDATDFVNNYKSDAISVSSEGLALTKINSGTFHLMDDEGLTTTYEDSKVIGCDYANKTFTIENKDGTNSINYKIWGSADGTNFEEILSEQTLVAGDKDTVVNNDYWKFIKMQAKAAAGTATVDVFLQVGA